MLKKIWDFFYTDIGEIVVHCLIAAAIMFLIDWWSDDWWELLGAVLIIAFFVLRELSQHHWQFSRMGAQSWKEWIYPAIVVLIIYAV